MKMPLIAALDRKILEVSAICEEMCGESICKNPEVHIRSETVAFVHFEKSVTEQKLLAQFWWVNARGGSWWWLLPSYAHAQGMRYLEQELYEIEQYNLKIKRKKLTPVSNQG